MRLRPKRSARCPNSQIPNAMPSTVTAVQVPEAISEKPNLFD
uniref:Uncharacterized protein n=1 Tax=Steinernema glaseri TaxID=37863 RepID=A0A1I7Y4A8_9BILA